MYPWIDNILLGLKETYDTNNIYDLYDFLDIQVVKLEPNNLLLNGNEALYYRDYFKNEVVFMRNDLNLDYEKFVLAHEIAHALLHTNVYEAAFNKNLLNICKFEKQANYFAIKLLRLELDPIEYEGFSLDQVASSLGLPNNILRLSFL